MANKIHYTQVLDKLPSNLMLVKCKYTKTNSVCFFKTYAEVFNFCFYNEPDLLNIGQSPVSVLNKKTTIAMAMCDNRFNKLFELEFYSLNVSNIKDKKTKKNSTSGSQPF